MLKSLAFADPDTAAVVRRQFEQAGVDGFNLSRTVVPECFDDFIALVVPQLQERGAYKTAYAPGTLRHKLFGRDRLPDSHAVAAHRWPVDKA